MSKYTIIQKGDFNFFVLTDEHKEFLKAVPAERHFMTEKTAYSIVDNLRDNNGSRMLSNLFEERSTLQALRNSVVMFYEEQFEACEDKESDEAYDQFTKQSMVVHVIDMAMYDRERLMTICRKFKLQ